MPGSAASEDYVPLLRQLLHDGRVWVRHGIVKAPAGESHYDIDDGDVLIDVQLSPNREQVLCRLASCAVGGAGLGVWCIPAEGTEVIVAIPDGDIQGDVSIIAVLASGTVPDGLDANGTVVIVAKQGAQVLIHDGHSNEAKALATKDDVDNHTHELEPMQVITTASAGTWDVTRKPPVPSPTPVTKTPPAIAGTQVLKAK